MSAFKALAFVAVGGVLVVAASWLFGLGTRHSFAIFNRTSQRLYDVTVRSGDAQCVLGSIAVGEVGVCAIAPRHEDNATVRAALGDAGWLTWTIDTYVEVGTHGTTGAVLLDGSELTRASVRW